MQSDTSNFQLRSYQIEAINKLYDKHYVAIEAPRRSGKTTLLKVAIGMELIESHILVIVPTSQQGYEYQKHIEQFIPKRNIKIRSSFGIETETGLYDLVIGDEVFLESGITWSKMGGRVISALTWNLTSPIPYKEVITSWRGRPDLPKYDPNKSYQSQWEFEQNYGSLDAALECKQKEEEIELLSKMTNEEKLSYLIAKNPIDKEKTFKFLDI